MSCNVRIERASNGYTVTMRDPKIVAANDKRSGKMGDEPVPPYRDPDVEYVFSDFAKMMKFLKVNLDKALPKDEFSSSFDEAAAVPDKSGD